MTGGGAVEGGIGRTVGARTGAIAVGHRAAAARSASVWWMSQK